MAMAPPSPLVVLLVKVQFITIRECAAVAVVEAAHRAATERRWVPISEVLKGND